MDDDRGVPLFHRYDRRVVPAEEILAQTGFRVGRYPIAVYGHCVRVCVSGTKKRSQILCDNNAKHVTAYLDDGE